MYTQPSKLASGGVAIYVKDNLDHSRIDDMCTTNNEFEVLWIEIKNRKGKIFYVDVLTVTRIQIVIIF